MILIPTIILRVYTYDDVFTLIEQKQAIKISRDVTPGIDTVYYQLLKHLLNDCYYFCMFKITFGLGKIFRLHGGLRLKYLFLTQNLSDMSVSVGDMQVSPSSKVRDLGVVFDQYLTFHDHISGICKSTHFHLRDIGRIRNRLTFDAQLIHALITSRLDFEYSL